MDQTASGIKYPIPADLFPSANWWREHALSTEAAVAAIRAVADKARITAFEKDSSNRLIAVLSDGTKVTSPVALPPGPKGDQGPAGSHLVSGTLVDPSRINMTDSAGRTVPVTGDFRGPQGLPGTNAAPADEAVAGYIGTGGASATQAAADDRYATPGVLRSKVKTDGTDQTARLNAELAKLAAGVGGTLLLPSGTIRLDGRVTIPYTLDGSGAPVQPAICIQGTGQRAHGRGSGVTHTAVGGTVLDMRWSDPNDLRRAKFYSLGFGFLELTGITFTDGGTGSDNPFFKHTNTTVRVRNVSGVGSPNRSYTNCTQDLIVAGGQTVPTSGDFSLDEDAPFQGYGSSYSGIWCDRIRVAIRAGAYFNGPSISDVTLWQKCGNPNGGAIEIDPGTGTTQGCYGVSISDVVCEAGSYKTVLNLRKLSRSPIANIGSFDYKGSATYQQAITLTDCNRLVVHVGYDDLDGVHPYLAATGGKLWQDQAILIHPTLFSLYTATITNGIDVRGNGGGANPSIRFARPGDATTGEQVTFRDYGRRWGFARAEAGFPLTIDTGKGGSTADVYAYALRVLDHTGALRAQVGAGIDGMKMGSAGDAYIKRAGPGMANVGKLAVDNALGSGATPPATAIRKMEVFDGAGNSLGFIPIYASL